MSAGKHTPGPWQAEPMTGRGAWVKGENGTWAALSCGDTDLEAEANARLIASAPDLLKMLDAALTYLRGENPGLTSGGIRNAALRTAIIDVMTQAGGRQQ